MMRNSCKQVIRARRVRADAAGGELEALLAAPLAADLLGHLLHEAAAVALCRVHGPGAVFRLLPGRCVDPHADLVVGPAERLGIEVAQRALGSALSHRLPERPAEAAR